MDTVRLDALNWTAALLFAIGTVLSSSPMYICSTTYSRCDQPRAMTAAQRMHKASMVHVVVTPGCSSALLRTWWGAVDVTLLIAMHHDNSCRQDVPLAMQKAQPKNA